MAMTPKQTQEDIYIPGVRQVAPAYDADIYYSMYTQGDYLICPKCGFKRIYANENVRQDDKVSHSTPVRSPNSLDIACPYATWSGAMATHATQTR